MLTVKDDSLAGRPAQLESQGGECWGLCMPLDGELSSDDGARASTRRPAPPLFLVTIVENSSTDFGLRGVSVCRSPNAKILDENLRKIRFVDVGIESASQFAAALRFMVQFQGVHPWMHRTLMAYYLLLVAVPAHSWCAPALPILSRPGRPVAGQRAVG